MTFAEPSLADPVGGYGGAITCVFIMIVSGKIHDTMS
jgi:hypothetical protein